MSTRERGGAERPRGLLLERDALRLAPRVLGVDGSTVRLALRWEALEPLERDWLSATPGLGHPTPWDPGGPRGGTLALPRESLERSPAAGTLARLLLAALRAFERPPRAPRIAGVLNVTPDSFSDGGRWLDPDRAVERALEMVSQGADLIDVGGESSRPGARAVGAAEELERVLPVLQRLAPRCPVPISIDTTKAEVAAAALDAGAVMVNDVSAGRFDPRLPRLVARRDCELVLMHMRGTPGDMQVDPRYGEVGGEVLEHLRARAAACLEAGVAPERLWVDPGIGFGKTLAHNLDLLRRLPELRSLGLPLYVGVSRKAFIGRLNEAAGRGGEPAAQRLGGTAAAVAACVAGGAELLRVHDVAVMSEAARVAWALRQDTGK